MSAFTAVILQDIKLYINHYSKLDKMTKNNKQKGQNFQKLIWFQKNVNKEEKTLIFH
jgi:hypothetical protein